VIFYEDGGCSEDGRVGDLQDGYLFTYKMASSRKGVVVG